MLTTTHKRTSLALITLIALLTVGGLALWDAPVPAAQALPFRPTLTPTATATATPAPPTATPEPGTGSGSGAPSGANLRLQAQFPPGWPWLDVQWQDVWTGVQWQDPAGAWHATEAWQGSLDEVVVDAEERVAGQKTWWVAAADLGSGPFRWQATHGPGGKLLAESDPFHLPANAGEWGEVYVKLVW
jgi:hypothetical protein